MSYLVGFEAENGARGLDRSAGRGKPRSFCTGGLDRGGDPSFGALDLKRSCAAGLLDRGVSLHRPRDLV